MSLIWTRSISVIVTVYLGVRSRYVWLLCSSRQVFGAVIRWLVCGWRLGEHRWLPC